MPASTAYTDYTANKSKCHERQHFTSAGGAHNPPCSQTPRNSRVRALRLLLATIGRIIHPNASSGDSVRLAMGFCCHCFHLRNCILRSKRILSRKGGREGMSASPFHRDFDWFAFLKRNPKSVTIEELNAACNRACSWVTCACGQLCKDLPRKSNNEPIDCILSDLGIDFYTALENHACIRLGKKPATFKSALNILIEIEKRTAYLLAERQKEAKP